MIRVAAAAVLINALASCASSQMYAVRSRVEMGTRVEEMARSCGLPAGSYKLQVNNRLVLQPPAGTPFKKVDCMLSRMRGSKLSEETGWIGNEAYARGKQ